MKLPKFPQVIAKGNSRVTIYRHSNAKSGCSYEEFKLAYYEAGKRQLKTYSSYEAARAAAEAERLAQGIPVDAESWRALLEIAKVAGISMPASA